MSDEPRVTVRNIGPGKPHVVYEDDDRLPLEDENARLRAQVGRWQEAARKAHDAMTNWHFVHGEPSALMSPEEAEMGEACKTIAALLDEERDDA